MEKVIKSLRTGVTVFAIGLCFIIALQASMGKPIQTLVPTHVPSTGPSNAPVWNKALSHRFTNCKDIATRPHNLIITEVVVLPVDGSPAYREQFSVAWAERKSNKFYVVGYCE